MRHTKIIATVGPASASEPVLDALVAAGVDIFRLNFSHGSREEHAAAFARIKVGAGRAGRSIAVLQDLGGPKIRTGRLEGGRPLTPKQADELRIATGDFVGGAGRVSTTYPELARAVRPGDRLLLDDGRIELAVKSSDGREIVTTVVYGGTLGEHKGINAPGVPLSAKAMTSKDEEDLRFGRARGIDMVALSFVRQASDLDRAREIMSAAGAAGTPLVAKLERPEALDHLDEILSASNGVMVARGDLGLELPLERLPRLQKSITRQARAAGVPVIVATQVFESMRTEPRPTRAEVTDAAHAVDAGADAIMLAGETAIGQYPLRAVETLDAVIRDAEADHVPPISAISDRTGESGHVQALCDAAATLAESGHADAIVAVTRAGKTARLLSALRPRAPIFAVTDRTDTANRLTLLWGVTPLVAALDRDQDGWGVEFGRLLREQGKLGAGARVVLVSVTPDPGRVDGNFLKFHRLD